MESTFRPPDALELFEDLPVPWYLAGGWAIDTFLGSETRRHVDLDIAILRADQRSLWTQLDGWSLQVATSPGVLESWDGTEIPSGLHVIWCRPSPDAPWAFELLLNDHESGDWLFRRNHEVRMALDSISRNSQDGLPYLVPEIVLLFKAKERRNNDEQDLSLCLERMNSDSRRWLHDSIAATHGPDHPWLSRV